MGLWREINRAFETFYLLNDQLGEKCFLVCEAEFIQLSIRGRGEALFGEKTYT